MIIAKTVEVLLRPHIFDTFSLDGDDVQGLQNLLQEEAILTPQALDLQVVEKDPEDDTIIIAAVEGSADYIISGDRHLQDLGTYRNGAPVQIQTRDRLQLLILWLHRIGG